MRLINKADRLHTTLNDLYKKNSIIKRLKRSFFPLICCFLIGIFLCTGSLAQTQYPQNFPPVTSCTSNDLILDSAKMPVNPGDDPCQCGGKRALKLSIKNKTGSTRTSFAFWGILRIYRSDGTLRDTVVLSDCFSNITANTTVIKTYKDSISFQCGESLKITNLFLAWTDANKKSVCPLDPATIAPKCGTLPEIQVVAGIDATINSTNATCSQAGSIKVEPFGGIAPYIVTLKKSDNTVVATQSNIPLNGSYTVNNLADGDYKIVIADSRPQTPCTVEKQRTITKSQAPSAPVSGGNQSVCSNGNASQTLTASATAPSGSSLVWYTVASGGTSSTTAPTQVGVGTKTVYAASQDNNTGCESSRTAVTLTIKGVPDAPGAQGAVECAQNPIQTLTATATAPSGGSIVWYDAATNGSTVSSPTRNTIGTSSYYAEAVGSNACHSLTRSEALLTIKATPSAPTLGVVNNCDGTSTLTATGLDQNATLTWSDGGSGNPRSVGAGTYTLTQTVNGCQSASSNQVTAAPKTTPSKPTVGVVDNCNGTSTLSVTGLVDGATVNWTDDASNHSNPRTVSSAGTYTATQTLNGCTSPASDAATAAPKNKPGAPTLSVQDNCNGTSTVTASNFSGTLSWSDGGSGNPRTVNSTSSLTVRQTVNGCISDASNSVTPAPKNAPPAPGVDVVNNCDGSSDLTATGFTGSLLWSNNATTASIHVTNAATYTVTQTVNGCTSLAGSGTSAPKATPDAPSLLITQPTVCELYGSIKICNPIIGATYTLAGRTPVVAESGKDVIFSQVAAGSDPNITVTSNGCPSQSASCGNEVTSCTASNPPIQSSSTQRTTNTIKESDKLLESQTRVLAYPNPYNDKVRFQVTSLEDGRGSLEVYNLLGQKVKTVYQGQINAGSQSFEMNVPLKQRSDLIYVLKVGDKKISGKLLQMDK